MCKLLLSSFLLFLLASLLAQTNVASGKITGVVGCYYGTWAYARPGKGEFRPGNINPCMCTHIYYTFFGIDTNGEITSLDESFDQPCNSTGNIAKTVALKRKNPDLKVLAAIGGWNEGSAKYSAMVSTIETRTKFINSVMAFIECNNFDGIEMDWEYPTQREGSSPDDFANFVEFLKELSAALKSRGLLLTAAVSAATGIASVSYDIPAISQYLDLINVMTYDYTGSWESQIGFNAPLRGNNGINVKASIQFWLDNGAPAHKLVMGIPFYGRSFTLKDKSQRLPGAPSIGGGDPGPYTQESSLLGFNEICEKIQNSGWNRRWNYTNMAPYAYSGNQWVGFDDPKSIKYKVKYLKSKKLAGAMVWSIETDDFRGICGERNVLLKTINRALGNDQNFCERIINK